MIGSRRRNLTANLTLIFFTYHRAAMIWKGCGLPESF